MDRKVILIGAIGGAETGQEKAATPCGVAAKVTMDRHAPQRDSGIVEAGGASNLPAFSEAKAHATLQARFALHGWQLDPDPGIDGRMRYIVTRWGRMRVLTNIDDVRALLVQIGGAQ